MERAPGVQTARSVAGQDRGSAGHDSTTRAWSAVILLVAGCVAALAAAGASLTDTNRPSAAATALHVAAGLSFVVVGLLAWSRQPTHRVGLLMMLVGFTMFMTDLRYFVSPVGYTIADYFTPLPYAILAHLLIAFPIGIVRSGRDRFIVWATYGWIAFSNLLPEVFFAPAETRNFLAIYHNNHLHNIVGNLHQALNVAVALVVVAVVVDHYRTATPPARRALAPVLWASGPIILSVVALNAVGVVDQLSWLDSVVPLLTPIAVMTLPLSFLIGLVRSELAHRAVGHLVIELGTATPTENLRDALARTFRDPSLRLVYWRHEAQSYVDIDGRPFEVPASSTATAVTLLERNGEPVAALLHDPSLEDDPWLIEAASAAASMALENERLRADVAAQLAEVRASRTRIVEAADAERRRVERDLHDGAQQRLVTLSLVLQRARNQVGNAADAVVAATLDGAAEQLKQSLVELRELAAGIHPAILTEGGLGPALRSLAEQAAIPVTVTSVPQQRPPQPVEAATYFVVLEALTNVVKHAHAHRARVCVRYDDGYLVTEVADDGVGGADTAHGSGLRGLADRVAAVDGRLDVISPSGAGTRIIATIPTA